MLTYDIILPVYDEFVLTSQMLECVRNSSVQPSNIFLWDNASSDQTPTLVDMFSDLPIRYHRSDKNIGVNPVWNYYLPIVESDVVAILNNDILFADYTIELVLRVLQEHSEVGICFPHEIYNKNELSNDKPESPVIKKIIDDFVPGFHYFIKRDTWLKIGPIASNMLLWYGDNHIWKGSIDLGKINAECLNAPIFHYSRATWNRHRTECDLMLQDDHKLAEGVGIKGVVSGIGRYTYGYDRISVGYANSSRLKIGSFCSIDEHITVYLGGKHNSSWGTTFPFGHIHQSIFPYHGEGHPTTNGDVVIGNDVWISNNVVIMSGVTIGDGAIITNNSCVVRDVSPYEIVGGNPAEHISYRFSHDIIKRMLKLKWWDWSDDKILSNLPLLCNPDVTKFLEANEG